MKKNIISLLAGIAILAGFSMVSVSAYAADSAVVCDTNTKLNVQTSANVTCEYSSNSSTIYGVGTGHKSGTKIYVSSSAMGKVYYKEVGTGKVASDTIKTAAENSEGVSSQPTDYTEVGD